MNYFAHGRVFLDDPYALAGAAVPDWLGVVDRRVRVRSHQARPFLDDGDPRVARLAAGIVQHHFDDAWFHCTSAFAMLSLDLCRRLREHLHDEDGLRPYFLGHILVEILLDQTLIENDPAALEEYYAALASVDGRLIESAIGRMAPRGAARLGEFIGLFCRERFLFDYASDVKLLVRLNQVMRRVKLPPLPEKLLELLPDARAQVQRSKNDLLTQPESAAESEPQNLARRTDDALWHEPAAVDE